MELTQQVVADAEARTTQAHQERREEAEIERREREAMRGSYAQTIKNDIEHQTELIGQNTEALSRYSEKFTDSMTDFVTKLVELTAEIRHLNGRGG